MAEPQTTDVGSPLVGSPLTVWVLRRWDRHDDEISLWINEEKAREDLAQYLRGIWGNVAWRDGVPEEPPADDQEAISLFYGPQDEWDEQGYSLYGQEVDGTA